MNNCLKFLIALRKHYKINLINAECIHKMYVKMIITIATIYNIYFN